jgi:hypothetical protein
MGAGTRAAEQPVRDALGTKDQKRQASPYAWAKRGRHLRCPRVPAIEEGSHRNASGHGALGSVKAQREKSLARFAAVDVRTQSPRPPAFDCSRREAVVADDAVGLVIRDVASFACSFVAR